MKRLNLDFSHPRVMAILNVTPDSFYAQSRVTVEEELVQRVREMVEQGADWIDIGGCSTRPGADLPTLAEELERVLRAVAVVRRVAPDQVISLDTFRAEVVRQVVRELGPVVVNDISAGQADPEMWEVVAREELPYIAMHMRGEPATMQQMTHYEDVVGEVVEYFFGLKEQLYARGIRQLIFDPGFGFAKTLEQNYALLAGLNRLVALGVPVLSALSRKSMIYKALGSSPEEALQGTTALNWESLRQGARLLRVHDVKAAKEVCRLYEIYQQAR